MKLIRGLTSLGNASKPCVVTIGNFDGVHRGHQAIIKTLIENAKKLGLPATVLTFEPTSREYFSSARADDSSDSSSVSNASHNSVSNTASSNASNNVLRLMQTQERVDWLFKLGIDQVVLLDFNQQLVNYSAERFIEDVLIDGLGVSYLSVGEDFRFGQNQQGGLDLLEQVGKERGFDVLAYEDVEVDGERVSSQRIRTLISEGDFIAAERLLGRPYSIKGVVSKGQQIGRTIDYPTANINLDQTVNLAVNGVYAVTIKFTEDSSNPINSVSENNINNEDDCYTGVANVGKRPTVDGAENRLEVHVFDYDNDCYEQSMVVTFRKKIRNEMKFESITALKQQIIKDAAIAQDFFATFSK